MGDECSCPIRQSFQQSETLEDNWRTYNVIDIEVIISFKYTSESTGESCDLSTDSLSTMFIAARCYRPRLLS